MVVVDAGGIQEKKDSTRRIKYAGIAMKELSLSKMKIEGEDL